MMAQARGDGVYNAVVIGAGTAGLVTAAGTAELGGRVALIERQKMGGDCLNFGCIPSKALISSARLITRIRRAPDWGLRKMEPQFEFNEVFERMRRCRAQIAPNDSQERFESLGVDVFRGEAKFLSPHTVQIGLRRIALTIHACLTFAEVVRKLGDKYNKTRLTPTARKVFSLLYRRSRDR